MRKGLLAVVAVVLLAACGDPAPTPKATGAQSAFNDADVRFLQAMIPHHQQAIDAAKLVAGHTDRAQLVTLADTITTSQAAEIQTMESWLQRWQQPLPATNQMAHEAEHVWGMMGVGDDG
jgi:uncharacterized protein (DUF305 family)